MSEQKHSDVLIVGAGLCGLMAAQVLQRHGVDYVIVDKGVSVGGRMATRRIGSGLADHGAQFFTARTDTFQQLVNQWLAADLVFVWSHGWSDGSLKRTAGDGYPRYAGVNGMNAIARYLAEPLHNVHVNTRITGLQVAAEGWEARDEQGNIYNAKALLMTPPVPQALDLFYDNRVELHPDDEDALKHIQYGPSLTAMFLIDGAVDLPEPGALQMPNDTVQWIADNQRKGISPDARLITLQTNVPFSRENWDRPDEDVLALLQDELAKYLINNARVVEAQLKRWRYAVALSTYPRDCLVALSTPMLVFAGDAFGGRGRVEGATLSGLAAGQALVDHFKPTT